MVARAVGLLSGGRDPRERLPCSADQRFPLVQAAQAPASSPGIIPAVQGRLSNGRKSKKLILTCTDAYVQRFSLPGAKDARYISPGQGNIR